MTYPTFNNGDTLPASDLNAIGLWLVKTQTVTGTPTTIVVNDAFSAQYQNYRITYSGFTVNNPANVGLRLGGAVTGYYGFGTYGNSGAPGIASVQDNNQTYFRYIGGGDSFAGTVGIEIQNPFGTQHTQVVANISVGVQFGNYTGRLANNTSYTGFTLLNDAGGGTFSGGTVRVYGYRN
jgi:hypothetical protein